MSGARKGDLMKSWVRSEQTLIFFPLLSSFSLPLTILLTKRNDKESQAYSGEDYRLRNQNQAAELLLELDYIFFSTTLLGTEWLSRQRLAQWEGTALLSCWRMAIIVGGSFLDMATSLRRRPINVTGISGNVLRKWCIRGMCFSHFIFWDSQGMQY